MSDAILPPRPIPPVDPQLAPRPVNGPDAAKVERYGLDPLFGRSMYADSDDVDAAIRAVFDEAFDGADGTSTSFVNDEPCGGLTGTLTAFDWQSAFAPARSGRSVAGHVRHATVSLRSAADHLRGEGRPIDWGESWDVPAASEAAWAAVLEDLTDARADFDDALTCFREWDLPRIKVTLGQIAALAYHLGALRQRLAAGER